MAGDAAHGGLVFGFDHDASQFLCSGVANYDSAAVAEFGFGRLERLREAGDGVERGLVLDADVDDGLRVGLEVLDQGAEGAARVIHHVEDDEGGEQAVAGGGAVGEDDVAGLFAAEDGARLLHFFEDVFVADGGAEHADAVAREEILEAHVGHGGGDNRVVSEAAFLLKGKRGEQEDAVAVDDAAFGGGEEDAVGVAVEGDAEVGVANHDFGGGNFGVEGAAIVVDIAAVGSGVGGVDVGTHGAEDVRGDAGGRAVGAIDEDATAGERQSGDLGTEPVRVFVDEARVGGEW